MRIIYCSWSFLALSLSLLASCRSTSPKNDIAVTEQAKPVPSIAETTLLAEQVYTYGYPLVVMNLTKDIMTHTLVANERGAPINQFSHQRTLPNASSKMLSPNADSLYSSAWVDLSKEPMILSLPDTGNHFYTMQMMSAWTEVFANPGTRTTGNAKINFIVLGPNWKGNLPVGMRQIQSPTNTVWILNRIQADEKDYPAVHGMQTGYKLTPLSAWGTEYKPALVPLSEDVDISHNSVRQVAAMSGSQFFAALAERMKENPPTPQDAMMVEKMKRLGIVPGQSFYTDHLAPQVRAALNDGAREALQKIVIAAKNPHPDKVNGWVYNFHVGGYGEQYDVRAETALTSLGVGLPQDITYLRSHEDMAGNPLIGQNNYILHMTKSELPPVNEYWTLTLYDNENHLVLNGLNRYRISTKDKLGYNADGSLDLYLQKNPPELRHRNNWLPTPRGKFNLVARLYWPKVDALNQQWRMPGIQKVQELKRLSRRRIGSPLEAGASERPWGNP